ncbi:MAG: hypothetical protein VR73_14510 [Gammaproteobacteria bacterium BRH_c0]|nr:MAG: hypothetical protein VR73_14510 [Gammaproteobacteria bacterium BRH_c0]
MQFKQTLAYTALTLAIGGTAIPSLAQIEEIVVTARKAEESLQQTPVAVTALNEDMLIKAQVTEIADLRRSAPNLSILPGGTGSSALVFVAIRGAAQVSPGGAADAAVGTYIDGVYYARPTGGNLDMFDVQQVEVLRGPQGTLFGRNTTGGALNIRTNDPTDEFEGYVKADMGNFNSRKIETVINIPITDELAARVSYRFNDRDGYGDYKGYTDNSNWSAWNTPIPAFGGLTQANLFGVSAVNNFNFAGLNQEAAAIDENMYGRAKLRWEPADLNLIATFGVDWSEMRDTGQRVDVRGINEGFTAGPFTLGQLLSLSGFDAQSFIDRQKFHDSYWNVDNSSANPVYNDRQMHTPSSSNKNTGAYLDLDIDLGEYQLKSISSYRENRSTGVVDLDGIPVNLLTFGSVWDQEQFSQEFQLSGTMGDNLEWITGIYYFSESSAEISRSRAFGIFADVFAPGVPPELANAPVNAGSDGVFDNTSMGAFAQANYQFTDSLRGTLGIRYTWDERDVLWRGSAPEPGQLVPANCIVSAPDNPGVCAQTDSATFDYPAWTLGLDYQVNDDLFLYAKTSGASMSGGWNVRSTVAPAFDPEDVIDIELGFKSDLFEDRVRFNTALFYSEQTDQQRFINEWDTVTNSTTQYVRNAGESTGYGAEFELTWLPWDGMEINSTLAFLKTEYDKYEVLEGITTGPNAGQTVLVDHSGENAPQAPEMTFGIGATQNVQTALGSLDLHVDYYYVDDTWFQDNTVRPGESAGYQAQQIEEMEFNAIPGYGLVNAMATLTTVDERWEVSLWGKNLADKEYHTGVANFYTAFGTANWYLGAPRTFGASLKYAW